MKILETEEIMNLSNMEESMTSDTIGSWMQTNWWIIAVCVLLVAVIVVIVLLFMKKRKAQQNEAMAQQARKIKQRVSLKPSTEVTVQEGGYGNLKLIVYKNGIKSGELSLDLKDSKIIGRSDLSEVYLDDDKLSRQHFALEYDGKHYYITDLQTTNGTFVNGKRIKEKTMLEQNDRIHVGRLEIIIRW